jgi:hypothetical protein
MILIRDDDANATTRPARLERAYAPLLEADLPVCLSVIPEVALDTRAPDGRRERFLDEASPDGDDTVALAPDTPLAAWIRLHPGAIDVLAHGLSHRRLRGGTELGALDQATAAGRLSRAAAILTRALGARPLGFVAPWDALSRGALAAATEAFALVSTGWVDRARLPLSAWPAFVAERVARTEALRVGRAWVLRHRGALLGPHTPPEAVAGVVADLTRGADVGVIVLHHWMFWDHPDPHPVITALARALRSHRVGVGRDALRHLDDLPPRPLADLARVAAARAARPWT